MTNHWLHLVTVTVSSADAKSDPAKKKKKQQRQKDKVGRGESKRLKFQLIKVTPGVSRPIELQFRIIVPR